MLRRITTIALALAALGAPSRTDAQALGPALRDRAIDASVLVSMDTERGASEGSGSIIDRRGYVLTNLHVVGHVHPFDGGAPGQLHRADGVVTLSHTTSSRSEARPTWLGRVVRTDIEADLALIRIESHLDGTTIDRGTTFPVVPIAERPVDLSDAVFALGFPLGMRGVTLTSGRITGLDVDADGNLAYLRVDADFNPGNSGGMLLNADGRLVGIPTQVSRSRATIAPIRKARPVERIPAAWRRALAEGPIADVRLSPMPELGTDDLSIRSAGSGFVVQGEELFFLGVPDGFVGQIQLGVDRSLESPVAANAALLSLDRPRATIRVAADNLLPVRAGDGRRLIVVMAVRRRRADGTQPGVSRITARISHPVTGGANVMTPMPVADSSGRNLAERPPELEAHYEVGTRSFRFEGGLLVDPLQGKDLAGGGIAGMAFTAPFVTFDEIWPFMVSLDYGARVRAGMWRDAFVFEGLATVGAKIALGSPTFMIEIPLYYSIGVVTAEEELSFSAYGYEVGLNARIRNFAVGLSWSEAHRGAFSVLRSLDATMWWYF